MSDLLTPEQIRRAVEVMQEYLAAPSNPDRRTPIEVQAQRDGERGQLIEHELKPLLQRYLADEVRLAEFKTRIDVNEVCLVEADAVVAMVDFKMRSPQQVSLGPDGLQRLFTASGVLSADAVRENLG